MNSGHFTLATFALTLLFPILGHAVIDPGPRNLKTQVITPDGCVIKLDPNHKPGDSLRVPVQANSSLGDLMVVKPRAITLEQYSNVGPENREIQIQKAKEIAQQIAREILSPEVLGSEDALITVQDLISTSLGAIPDGTLNSINEILEADLSALDDPSKAPEVKRKTDNALAQLTQTITKYKREGLDINTVANQVSSMANWPIIGRFFDNVGDILRKNFQSVKRAIDSIGETFDQGVAHMRLRHQQMKQARLELQVLERYEELSYVIAEEVERLAVEYRAQNDAQMDDSAKVRFDQNILLPLANRKQAILDLRTSIVKTYFNFRGLMDQNLNLIMVIANLKQTASLELRGSSASLIISNELTKTQNMAEEARKAMTDMSNAAIAKIKEQGIRQREFANRQLDSSASMVSAIDEIIAELNVAVSSNRELIGRLNQASNTLNARLNDAIQRGGADFAAIADQVGDEAKFRKPEQLALPAPAPSRGPNGPNQQLIH